MMARSARFVIRVASWLVPRHERADWFEEWLSELESLERAHASDASVSPENAVDLPGPLAFARGSIAHAFWAMTAEWTMNGFWNDLRYSLRTLVRAPGFTLVAALTLALGIGANATIFSLVNGLLLRAPAGVHEPDRLVQIARSYETDPRWDSFSWPALRTIESEARTLSGVAGYGTSAFVVGSGVDAEQVIGQYVVGDYFSVLGVRPHIGRVLRQADALAPGAHPVVVLSHAFWQRRFGSDPGIVGRTIAIRSEPYTVVGVASAGFAGVESVGAPPSIWVPAMQHPSVAQIYDRWGTSWIGVVGRLGDGVTIEEARAAMAVVATRLREAAPVNEGILVLLEQGIGLDPDGRSQASAMSLILLVIVGLVLLLTCTNVANLFLARATGRSSEMAVRVALGAGRARLVRQLVTETLTIATLATALALPLVLSAGRVLPAVFPFTLAVSVGADANVLAFLVAVGIVAGLLFGMMPAWVIAKREVAQVLREGLSGGRHSTRLRDGMVVVQLALSLGLVTGAALLGRSVLNAHVAEPGFEPDGLTAAFIDLAPTGRYDTESGIAFYDRVVREVGQLPGVAAVTLANQVPLVGGHARAGARPVDRDEIYEAEFIIVGPDYFETMGIPLLRGRALGGIFDEPENVVVVNEAFASLYWPGGGAIGQRIEANEATWRIVGVAGDVQMRSLRDSARPAVYYPVAISVNSLAASPTIYWASTVLHVRGVAGRPLPASMIREAVASLDPGLPIAAVVDVREALAGSMSETRTIGYLVGAFALLALLLAAVGLYGLVSYGASQRVREFAIRVALGAKPVSIVRLVLARGLMISALGVALGASVSYALGRALQGLLYGVAAGDPTTLLAAAAGLVMIAAAAAWLPARRASRMDAAFSLRG